MIRDPGDGAYSQSPYGDSERQAGAIAWYYEHEGVRPMLIGHSQGRNPGCQRSCTSLPARSATTRRVFNPLTGQFEERTTDRRSAEWTQSGPWSGLSVAYASVSGHRRLGAGAAEPLESAATSSATIPDTVDDFTGYRIAFDLFAWDAPGLGGREDISTLPARRTCAT